MLFCTYIQIIAIRLHKFIYDYMYATDCYRLNSIVAHKTCQSKCRMPEHLTKISFVFIIKIQNWLFASTPNELLNWICDDTLWFIAEKKKFQFCNATDVCRIEKREKTKTRIDGKNVNFNFYLSRRIIWIIAYSNSIELQTIHFNKQSIIKKLMHVRWSKCWKWERECQTTCDKTYWELIDSETMRHKVCNKLKVWQFRLAFFRYQFQSDTEFVPIFFFFFFG